MTIKQNVNYTEKHKKYSFQYKENSETSSITLVYRFFHERDQKWKSCCSILFATEMAVS